ncbi:MAG: hypothetical protein HUJ68_05245 [Clostridia bacterium]|nr:hypothetical protein [Clostridia bacterium]
MNKKDLLKSKNLTPYTYKPKKKDYSDQYSIGKIAKKLWMYFGKFKGKIALVVILCIFAAITQGTTIFFIGYLYDH